MSLCHTRYWISPLSCHTAPGAELSHTGACSQENDNVSDGHEMMPGLVSSDGSLKASAW